MANKESSSVIERVEKEFIDPVGKDCQCIYPFEKHYIEMIFNERIEEEEKKLAEAEEKLTKMPLEQKELFEGVPSIYKHFIHDLKVVRDRFNAMTDCKG